MYFVIPTVSQPHNNFQKDHFDKADPQFVFSLFASEPASLSSSMALQKLSSSSHASKSTSARRLEDE